MELPHTYFYLTDETPLRQYLAISPRLNRMFSLYYFEPTSLMEKLLYALKYDGNKAIGLFFGRKLAATIAASNIQYSGIIGVPLHSKRKRKRGFNQVDIIGKIAAEALSIPYFNEALIRVKNTPPLSKVKGERDAVLANAFEVKQTFPEDGHFLLLDDIFTTGATLNACATTLLKHNPISLSIATIAYRN